MRDHIVIAQHKETKLFHALFYVNHPTPSGWHRPILKLSTKHGKATEKEALEEMAQAFAPERLKEIDLPVLD